MTRGHQSISGNASSQPPQRTIHRSHGSNYLHQSLPRQTKSRQIFALTSQANLSLHLLPPLCRRTSGCTIEQLQQINRELMAEIWRTRHENNRMKVYTSVTRVFNEAISDIESTQQVMQASQDT